MDFYLFDFNSLNYKLSDLNKKSDNILTQDIPYFLVLISRTL